MVESPWMSQLERDGFVHLPGVLDADYVARLAILSLQSVDDHAFSDDLVRTGEGVPVKLLYPLDKYRDFVPLLGSHPVRAIVDALLPVEDSVLTWEDVLIKPPLTGVEVGVHQDIGLDPTRDKVHSLGISLNGDRDNPVYFLPGSHRLGPLTRTSVKALWRDCRDQFRPVTTQPGDVVIHNVHVLHHSEANLSPQPRVTWYLEFRSMNSLLENGPWNNDWVHRRRAIWVHARVAAGDHIGENESKPVKSHLERLNSGVETLRVPQVTETVRYDSASQYNHFSDWNDDWRDSKSAPDGTHHVNVHDGQVLYGKRFHEVLKFHAPGLAPVLDDSGAYHITPDGNPAYESRHVRTFGFYEGRSAVHSADGWFHILTDGSPLYAERYAWCGNFQDGRCPVRLLDERYSHIDEEGRPAYSERHRYAGDFKDGFAVVQRDDGRHSHIDQSGALLHGRWFLDLDVFHKNFARARDEQGWHHVDIKGQPLYQGRYRNVEPFYNGQARVEGTDGSLSVIGERGETLVELRGPLRSPLEELSGDMVGMWKTQAIRAAVELGVFESLPASAQYIERSLELSDSVGIRLMRALTELGLVRRDEGGAYHATEKGALLQLSHPLSLADAAPLWGGETYAVWAEAVYSLRTRRSAFRKLYGQNLFEHLQDRPEQLRSSHRAFASYARHDYQSLATACDLGIHDHILDAGGGTGELAFALLRTYPNLAATVMDLPEVIRQASPPNNLRGRCQFVAGNFFGQWPVSSHAVVLARVLHDWPDQDALRILARAREAMPTGGTLYAVEMVLDDHTGTGGLLDLNMLIVAGGAERTEEQFKHLLDRAGFELIDVVPTPPVSSVIRARAF